MTKLPAKTCLVYELTMCVYDIAKNCMFYYGDEKSCLELEFTNDRYMALPISLSNELTV
jgi:hypothetical protein